MIENCTLTENKQLSRIIRL